MAAKKKPAAKAAKKTAAKKPATSASKSSRSAAKKPTPPRAALAAAVTVIHQIPLASIERDTQQPREHFPDAEIQLLADDIRLRGVQQPITVRQAGEDRYIIVTGERRWLASQIAEAATIPAFIVADAAERPELQRLLDQTKENTLRQDLTLIEKAKVLRRLRDDHGVKVGELPALAKSCGLGEMSRSHVSNMIRLTELPQWAQDKINAGEWSFTHGKHLLVAADVPDVIEKVHATIEKARPGTWQHDNYGTADGISRLVEDAFEELYPNVSRIRNDDWVPEKERIYYDAKKYAADHGELNLREVDGRLYALNRELHQQLNAEAKVKHEAKQEKKQQQLATRKKQKNGEFVETDEAPPKPARVSDQTLREHLHAWLRDTLLADLFGTEQTVMDHSGTLRAVASWAAFGAPAGNWSNDNAPISAGGRTVLEKQSCIDLLTILEADGIEQDAIALHAARNAVQHMSLPSTVALAHHLRLDLDRYRVTEESLRMFTNTGLDELADIAGDPAIRAAKKAVDKRLDLLKHAETIGMPTLLRALYDEALQQIRESQQEFAERGPICEHCGEYDCEDTCPGAMAARGDDDDEADDRAEPAEEAEA